MEAGRIGGRVRVVRRRLFLPLDDEPARDDVCRAFNAVYRDGGAEFPSECREARYLERMKACYPIHPEVFDRLYNDWATLERFQRTRGVLRLMAAVIHDLWVRNDASLLIMPGSIGLDAVTIREELTRYLPEGWTSVLESDVDGRNSGPLRVDSVSKISSDIGGSPLLFQCHRRISHVERAAGNPTRSRDRSARPSGDQHWHDFSRRNIWVEFKIHPRAAVELPRDLRPRAS